MALEGYVKFDIELVEKEIVEVLFEENPAPTPNNIVSGSGQKIEDLNTDAHKIACQGLGRGYDITGLYASLASVKASVLDLNMLNEHNHITLLDGLNISDNQKYTSQDKHIHFWSNVSFGSEHFQYKTTQRCCHNLWNTNSTIKQTKVCTHVAAAQCISQDGEWECQHRCPCTAN